MDSTTARKVLAQDDPENLYDVVQPALKEERLREELVEGCFDKREMYRYNCVRVVLRAMKMKPDLFYPYWDRFAKGIESPNSFQRSSSAQSIAYLAIADKDHKLDLIFDRYLGLLDDSKVMASHYFLDTLHVVYHARPEFQSKIFACLLSVDKTKHLPSRKDMLKADVIGNLDQIFDTLSPSDKKKAITFVKNQSQSSSPKARKMSKDFLAKHE